jgi:1-deoxy-D-xylulose-5-phosphate synthase
MAYPLLTTIDQPAQLRALDRAQLQQLANELRAFVLESVSKTGGHLSSNLGTVELTIALHYVFDTPEDRIVWDVGHQSYPHKILTGRREQMGGLRMQGGISGFPRREESAYDAFGTAHSSTSISAALGMARAAKQKGEARHTIAVIGDGAISAGMAFEGMNNAGVSDANLLVVLNDNEMSISPAVGAMNRYLARLVSGRAFTVARNAAERVLARIPRLRRFFRRFELHAKGMVVPSTLFEHFGFNYIGPIDGHDLEALIPTLRNVRNLKGPQLLHVVTRKGQGYKLAEADPVLYHGVSKFEPAAGIRSGKASRITFTEVFGEWLCDMAQQDARLVGITPAMREGSGLVKFAQRFPDRYYDVGIAEQHAVTFAAGLACEGLKPVVAIYSTFLQRAYDQFIHDVQIQNLPVLFALDRAGVVGADGPTHHGAFDISYLSCIPNITVMVPADENECRQMLYTGFMLDRPAAVRYPRGAGAGVAVEKEMRALPIGKAQVRRSGRHVAILVFGTLLKPALEVGEMLDATVVNMRFVKPLDESLIAQLAGTHDLLVTVEDNVVRGGAGSAVAESLAQQDIAARILHLGLPDRFVDHGDQSQLMSEVGLDRDGIRKSIEARLADRARRVAVRVA